MTDDSDDAATTGDPADDAGGGSSPAMSGTESLDSLIIVALFVGVNRFFGLSWAILAVTIWSVKASVTRRRRNLPVGKLIPIITAFIVVRGVIGIVTDSEAVYFGIGIGARIAGALFLIGSVIAGRDFVGWGLPRVMHLTDEMVVHPAFRAGTRWITLIGGVYYLTTALFDTWLFNNSSVNGFVIIRFFVSWPLGVVAILACFAVISRYWSRIPSFPGLMVLLEREMAGRQAG